MDNKVRKATHTLNNMPNLVYGTKIIQAGLLAFRSIDMKFHERSLDTISVGYEIHLHTSEKTTRHRNSLLYLGVSKSGYAGICTVLSACF